MGRQTEGLTESHTVGSKFGCERCGSSNAVSLYSDGHTYCYACPTEDAFQWADGGAGPHSSEPLKERRVTNTTLAEGTIEAIPNRKIDLLTAEKFRYAVGQFNGQKCHIAPYMDEHGRVVAQKIRLPGKDFLILGDLKDALPFFGQHLCRDGGKMIVITEGEIDALSVTQAMGLKWPAVSVPTGAKGAVKAFGLGLAWLEKFEKVVIAFDMDEPGRAAAEEVAQMLSPGKAFFALLPLKDANEMVKAGRSGELVEAIWGAKSYRPAAIVDLADIREEALTEAAWGLPWPWVTMTKATYGIRRGALYTWGAGTGSGKTTLMKQLALTAMRPDLCEDHSALFPMPAPRKVALLLFEEAAGHTLKTIGGMAIRKRVHVPGTDYDRAAHAAAVDSFEGLMFPMSLKGSRNWDTVEANIRFLCIAYGILDFIIDPMTALVATAEDERRALDGMMAELAGLVEELGITVHLVSHLATPDGKSHEAGGQVQEKHFRGSRAVAFWSHYMIGLERDKQNPDCPTTVRGLKDRLTGDAVGPFIALRYDRETGLMHETSLEQEAGAFVDETL
jgi:twinkle protein